MVVYKFICKSCDVVYIGETRRHLSTRVRVHLRSDKSSHVNLHINRNQECKARSDESCFTIIDSDRSRFKLKIKEGIHISAQKPSLNAQLTHEALTLFF